MYSCDMCLEFQRKSDGLLTSDWIEHITREVGDSKSYCRETSMTLTSTSRLTRYNSLCAFLPQIYKKKLTDIITVYNFTKR